MGAISCFSGQGMWHSDSWFSHVLGKAGCLWCINPSAQLVLQNWDKEREVGIAVVWLFLLERFLTCVGSISLEPGNTGATH